MIDVQDIGELIEKGVVDYVSEYNRTPKYALISEDLYRQFCESFMPLKRPSLTGDKKQPMAELKELQTMTDVTLTILPVRSDKDMVEVVG